MELPFTPETAQRFDGLYQLLSRKYRVEEIRREIAGEKFRLFKVENMDDLLDELIAADPDSEEVKDERLPYWAEIWPSAIALADFILRHSLWTADARILEIGCGLGLVGMAAAKKGGDILLTDYQPDALRFTEINWLMNLGVTPPTALMDWRNPDMDRRFDVILASDVAYEKRFFYPLIDTFRRLLAPDGHLFLSEPNRDIAAEFFRMLEREGFRLERHQVTVHFHGKNLAPAVYDIRKS